ncbi:DUF5325 family protein [Virgibacillus soli]|uniref:DUF5325 family protein n=1 Tax=Paracerasibacillus soli TaxID=480284 RepID=A0ABU5CNY0_9BACI|nr:DUF5325 family protein [Virgibacillus soli]MDY0408064.1 DUF5325 family protein [Virgibacillus soli]
MKKIDIPLLLLAMLVVAMFILVALSVALLNIWLIILFLILACSFMWLGISIKTKRNKSDSSS